MFMLMDDVGALFWRFARKLTGSSEAREQAAPSTDRKGPPSIVPSPAAE
jgi:hypothetical protein